MAAACARRRQPRRFNLAPDLIKHDGRYYLYYPAAGTNWVVTAKNNPGAVVAAGIDRRWPHRSRPCRGRRRPPLHPLVGRPCGRDVCRWPESRHAASAGVRRLVRPTTRSSALGAATRLVVQRSRHSGRRAGRPVVLRVARIPERVPHLGRCTLLEPIEWTRDGWFCVAERWPAEWPVARLPACLANQEPVPQRCPPATISKARNWACSGSSTANTTRSGSGWPMATSRSKAVTTPPATHNRCRSWPCTGRTNRDRAVTRGRCFGRTDAVRHRASTSGWHRPGRQTPSRPGRLPPLRRHGQTGNRGVATSRCGSSTTSRTCGSTTNPNMARGWCSNRAWTFHLPENPVFEGYFLDRVLDERHGNRLGNSTSGKAEGPYVLWGKGLNQAYITADGSRSFDVPG